MDPSILFNFDTPFDDSKLNILDTLTQTFYTTANSNDRELANNILNKFQQIPQSYASCEYIIEKSQNKFTIFYALNIIESVIKSHWGVIDNNNKLIVRNFLIDKLIKLVNDDNLAKENAFLINKYNIVIVAIAKAEWTTTWEKFISELCTSAKYSQNLCKNNMKILQLFSEEINIFWKDSITFKKAQELKRKMYNEFIEVITICKYVFDNSQNVNPILHLESLRLFAEYTVWFPINYVLDSGILGHFFNVIKTGNEDIKTQIIKCFGKIFSIQIESNDPNFLQVKGTVMEIYKCMINEVVNITKGCNLVENSKVNNALEKFSLEVELAIINFFQQNFTFIEQNDFQIGTCNSNNFTNNYGQSINYGLSFMVEFFKFQNDEIFKAACEFWYIFIFKVAILEDLSFDPTKGFPRNKSISEYIMTAQESFFVRNYYLPYFDLVRDIAITRMNKPIEVKITIDENGDLICDPSTNTIYEIIHNNLSDILKILTYFDQAKTTQIMEGYINQQLDKPSILDKALLNSVSWSVGAISQTLDENIERKFIVEIIRALLTLCEQTKGKDNKAICASNIMYVVGQYPRFLNKYWKFLKTVVKKLFEFMHEFHPGVRDFACETFLRIAFSCGNEFIKVYDEEQEPYINTLVRSVGEDTKDLKEYQQLMFYEALGKIISHEQNLSNKSMLISQLMSSTYVKWNEIFLQAQSNKAIIQSEEAAKTLELIIRINERVCFSTEEIYWEFGKQIFPNMIGLYLFYSDMINEYMNNNQIPNRLTKSYISYNRAVLKYLATLIGSFNKIEIISTEIMPELGKIVEKYKVSINNNRDPNVFLVFIKVIEKLKETQTDYLCQIYQHLCVPAFSTISSDFVSFPEYRSNFFLLIQAYIEHTTKLTFTQNLYYINDVVNIILYECKHNQPNLFEIGLYSLSTLLNTLVCLKLNESINCIENFCVTYYFQILKQIIEYMTDSCHKGGFKRQAEIIKLMILMIEKGVLKEGIFDQNCTNKEYVFKFLVNEFQSRFQNLNKTQIEAICIEMFNKCYNEKDFKNCLRDFLISLNKFSGNNDALFEEEKNLQLQEAREIESKKQELLRTTPIYTKEFQEKINSSNYMSLA